MTEIPTKEDWLKFEAYEKRITDKIKKHLDEDIKESKKSIKEDKELKEIIGRMR